MRAIQAVMSLDSNHCPFRIEVVPQNSINLGHRVDLMESTSQVGATRQPASIPPEMLAKLECRASAIALRFQDQPCMVPRHGKSF